MDTSLNKPEPAVLAELRHATVGPESATGDPVLEDVSLKVCTGDWWVLGGGQWSGKTALMATIAGLQRVMHGDQRLFGTGLDTMAERELVGQRQRIGMVFQNGGRLFSHFSVGENIVLPLCYHRNCPVGDVWDQAARLIDALELSRWVNATPDRISPVHRQRAGLARALIMQPELLLLDNPLGGLPSRERIWWLDMLDELHAGHPFLNGRGITIVASAEDMQVWLGRGTQFAVVDRPRCHVLGGPQELHACNVAAVRELLHTTGREQ